MTRKQVVECLFCGENPCVCNGQAKSSGAKPKLKSTPISASAPLSSTQAKESASSDHLFHETKRTRFREPTGNNKAQSVLEFEQAVRNLESLLSNADKRKYAHILRPSKTGLQLKQLMEWKRRWKDGASR